MQVKDMLAPSKYFFFLLLITVCLSCTSKKDAKKTEAEAYPKTDELLHFSSEIISKKEYENVLSMLNDSVKNWERHQLTGFIDKSTIEFKFDTLLCFNTTLDKMLTIRLARQLLPMGKLDAMTYYYGVKIENKWYFFSGPVLFVGRKDLSRPTSFSELHQSALEQVFISYLKKSPTGGGWEINERFFGDLTSGAWYVPGWPKPETKEDWDKVYLYHINQNWKNRGTTEYPRNQ